MPRKVGAFWFGANSCEYYAFKGGFYIYEHECCNFPNPPSRVFRSDVRIDTKSDFIEALKRGEFAKIEYSDFNT